MDDENGLGAWLGARFGYAIDTYVDRAVNKGQVLYNSNPGYGMDEFGNLYTLGQPGVPQSAPGLQAQKFSPSPLMILLILGGVYLLAKD